MSQPLFFLPKSKARGSIRTFEPYHHMVDGTILKQMWVEARGVQGPGLLLENNQLSEELTCSAHISPFWRQHAKCTACLTRSTPEGCLTLKSTSLEHKQTISKSQEAQEFEVSTHLMHAEIKGQERYFKVSVLAQPTVIWPTCAYSPSISHRAPAQSSHPLCGLLHTTFLDSLQLYFFSSYLKSTICMGIQYKN